MSNLGSEGWIEVSYVDSLSPFTGSKERKIKMKKI